MDSLTANEAKSQFGDMLLKAQRAPVQINKNGKPIAVIMSMDEYEGIEAMKLRLLQFRVDKAKAEIQTGNTVDGELFFAALESGQHDLLKFMSAYQLTSEAQSDLIEIRRYTLANWGVQQSQKYLSDMRQTMQLLAESPTLGKPRPDIESGAFSFPYVSHVIYYLQHQEQIIVFGVLHKRMVPTTHLEHRETPSHN